MKNNLKISFLLMAVLTILLGGVYPLITFSVGKILFPHLSKGSLIIDHSTKTVLGSKWIAQPFVQKKYFHPRPSYGNYQTAFPFASNINLYSKKYPPLLKDNIIKYIRTNTLSANAKIPMDAICFSASGVDPHISLENALLQASRVAKARNISISRVKALIKKNTISPMFGFIGTYRINVLLLNMELDNSSK